MGRTGSHLWGECLGPPEGGSVAKNSPANARDVGDTSSIPGSGRSPRGENGNPLQYSWRIPWTEELGGLQSMESQGVRQD